MSFLENLKKVSSTAEELTQEIPKIAILSHNYLTAENYTCVKLFGENGMILGFEEFDLYIDGKNLCIECFSPARIKLCGSIEKLTYASNKVYAEEV